MTCKVALFFDARPKTSNATESKDSTREPYAFALSKPDAL